VLTVPVRRDAADSPRPRSNYGKRKKAGWIYLTATLEAATWGAELYDHLARLRELGIEAIED